MSERSERSQLSALAFRPDRAKRGRVVSERSERSQLSAPASGPTERSEDGS
jgi:hypothetical protein